MAQIVKIDVTKINQYQNGIVPTDDGRLYDTISGIVYQCVCPECGADVAPDDFTCVKCGRVLE